jgi:hypothetical protein
MGAMTSGEIMGGVEGDRRLDRPTGASRSGDIVGVVRDVGGQLGGDRRLHCPTGASRSGKGSGSMQRGRSNPGRMAPAIVGDVVGRVEGDRRLPCPTGASRSGDIVGVVRGRRRTIADPRGTGRRGGSLLAGRAPWLTAEADRRPRWHFDASHGSATRRSHASSGSAARCRSANPRTPRPGSPSKRKIRRGAPHLHDDHRREIHHDVRHEILRLSLGQITSRAL